MIYNNSINGTVRAVQVFTSGTAQTYTPTIGTKTAWIRMVGGGGGGGGSAGASGNLGAGGGGGGGGYVEHFLKPVSGTYTYTVGAGGAGGAAGNNNGSAGTASTFSGGTLSAGGGAGGGGSTAQAPIVASSPVVGGVASNGGTSSGGNISNAPGADGGTGVIYSTNGCQPGTGGGTLLGQNTGAGDWLLSTGVITRNGATNTGAGGEGGATFNQVSAAGEAGGNGADGVIIITEYS